MISIAPPSRTNDPSYISRIAWTSKGQSDTLPFYNKGDFGHNSSIDQLIDSMAQLWLIEVMLLDTNYPRDRAPRLKLVQFELISSILINRTL